MERDGERWSGVESGEFFIDPMGDQRTAHAGVIRLHVSFGDTAVLDHEGIPFAAITAKDGGSVEGKV